MACEPTEDSGQLVQPPSLIRVFSGDLRVAKKCNVFCSCGQPRFWSDCKDIQADQSLPCMYMWFCRFCHAPAHMYSHHPLSCQTAHEDTEKNLQYGPRQANLVLIAYASSEGSGEPAHPRSLARTFAARSYKQWVKRNLQTESQIPGPTEWLGMRS